MAVHKHRKQVLDRLARIAGHVEGVRRMVEEERDCADVLVQISAVRAALASTASLLLDDHLEGCVAEAIRDGQTEVSLGKLRDALRRMI